MINGFKEKCFQHLPNKIINEVFILLEERNRILPYRVYILPFFLLAVVGLIDSIYLGISHYRSYTDVSYSSFCALSKAINCDTVSQSPWSILWGMPVSLWGILAYMLILAISIPAFKDTTSSKTYWNVLFVLSALCSLSDLFFAYISATKIQAYCIMCIASYAISFGLLYSAWIIRRRFKLYPLFYGFREGLSSIWKNKILLFLIMILLAFFLALRLFLPHYWLYKLPPLSEHITTGFTEDNHPWIGAKNPTISIEEFTDYQCFQCSKMHMLLRLLINRYPHKIRLIHHHYPLDNQFNPLLAKTQLHEGSGQMALLAIAAGKQNKFWQANDFLYAIAREKLKAFNINKFALKLGLMPDKLKKDMSSPDTIKLLEGDIREGLKNKMAGTPSFIINGKVYQGTIPQDVLEKLLL